MKLLHDAKYPEAMEPLAPLVQNVVDGFACIAMAAEACVRIVRADDVAAPVEPGAARQILLVSQHLRDPKTGLYYHGWDQSRTERWADPQTGLSRCFWGRAVGWYVMGIVETLNAMPADHPAT